MNESNEMTSKQDKEAFEKWKESHIMSIVGLPEKEARQKLEVEMTPEKEWLAACEYKDAQYRPRYEESEDAIYINGKKFYSEKVVKEWEEAASLEAKEADKERAKSRKLVEALEFYMWQNKYNGYQSNRSGEFEYYPAKIIEDAGKTARQALAEYKAKEGGENGY